MFKYCFLTQCPIDKMLFITVFTFIMTIKPITIETNASLSIMFIIMFYNQMDFLPKFLDNENNIMNRVLKLYETYF